MKNDSKSLWSSAALLMALAACTAEPTPPPPPAKDVPKASVRKDAFGTTADGAAVDLYTLTNASGMEVRAMTYGGIIVSLRVPDRTGALGDVVLGYDSLDGYLKASPYFGAIIGRYGNRIARRTLQARRQGVQARRPTTARTRCTADAKGFDKVVWKAESFQDAARAWASSSPTQRGRRGGLSRHARRKVTYTLTPTNELARLRLPGHHRQADAVNLTQHSYFNLAGDGSGDILGHELTIKASRFTPVDETLIPTGELKSVEGTPFDFRTPHGDRRANRGQGRADQVRPRLRPQLRARPRAGDGLQLAARVHDPTSGRVMEVSTTEPGLQFYSGNFLDGTITGKGGTSTSAAPACASRRSTTRTHPTSRRSRRRS